MPDHDKQTTLVETDDQTRADFESEFLVDPRDPEGTQIPVSEAATGTSGPSLLERASALGSRATNRVRQTGRAARDTLASKTGHGPRSTWVLQGINQNRRHEASKEQLPRFTLDTIREYYQASTTEGARSVIVERKRYSKAEKEMLRDMRSRGGDRPYFWSTWGEKTLRAEGKLMWDRGPV
ncbi:hypothetical protein IAT38_007782 [Cryptococcus sp. DSM 104549]